MSSIDEAFLAWSKEPPRFANMSDAFRAGYLAALDASHTAASEAYEKARGQGLSAALAASAMIGAIRALSSTSATGGGERP